MNEIFVCVWCLFCCVDFSMQHILVMVLGNKIKNVIYAKQLILSMRTSSLQPNLQVEVSHHATALHVSSVQQAAPTQKYARTHRGLRGHHSLTSNILLNWVIPLSTASKLHFCFWDFFSSPPTSAGRVRGQAATYCLAAALIERGQDASLRPHEAISCIPNGRRGCTGEPPRHCWVGGRETPRNAAAQRPDNIHCSGMDEHGYRSSGMI